MLAMLSVGSGSANPPQHSAGSAIRVDKRQIPRRVAYWPWTTANSSAKYGNGAAYVTRTATRWTALTA